MVFNQSPANTNTPDLHPVFWFLIREEHFRFIFVMFLKCVYVMITLDNGKAQYFIPVGLVSLVAIAAVISVKTSKAIESRTILIDRAERWLEQLVKVTLQPLESPHAVLDSKVISLTQETRSEGLHRRNRMVLGFTALSSEAFSPFHASALHAFGL